MKLRTMTQGGNSLFLIPSRLLRLRSVHLWQTATICITIALALLTAACAGQASPTPTSVPKAPPSPMATKPAAVPTKPAAVPTQATSAEAKSNELTTVNVGDLPAMSTAGLYVAMERGYFAQQGIQPEISKFDSGANMIPPLGTGQMDVGAAGTSPGLFNAVARDVNIKIVADKGNLKPGYGFLYLVARKDLYDSGQFKTPEQLKGKSIAVPTKGMAAHYQLDMALKSVGLKESDIDLKILSFSDQIAALKGKAIDGAVANEPFVTTMVNMGLAAKVKSADQIAPNEQVAIIMYSQKFIERSPEIAKKFMVAYLKGVRDYFDAISKNKDKDEIIRIILKHTGGGNPKDYEEMSWTYINPNGYVDSKALLTEEQWELENGFIKSLVPIEKVVDNTFVDYAVKQLGEYK